MGVEDNSLLQVLQGGSRGAAWGGLEGNIIHLLTLCLYFEKYVPCGLMCWTRKKGRHYGVDERVERDPVGLGERAFADGFHGFYYVPVGDLWRQFQSGGQETGSKPSLFYTGACTCCPVPL